MLRQLAVIVFTVTYVASAAETAFKFDGCYVDISKSPEDGVSYHRPKTNLNVDCAQFCGFTGYILAATKGDICRCTNLQPHPNTIQQTPYDIQKDGDTVCLTTCPAAVHTTDDGVCEGDVCCGDVTRDAWSVYTVGGIDILEVIFKRIKRAISNTRHMAWINEAYTESCSDNFRRHPYPGPIGLLLESKDWKMEDNIRNVQACQQECIRDGLGCRSISYTQSTKQCQLNRKSSIMADLLPVDTDTVLHDRLCTSKVNLLPTNFSLVMKEQDFTVKHFPPFDKVPLHTMDFELDLTNSNSEDALTRSFETSVADSAVYSAESGFELGNSATKHGSKENTQESSESESTGKENSGGVKAGMSVNAEAGAGAFGCEVKVKAGFSSSLGTSFSSTSSQSSTRSRSFSSSTNWEEEMSESRSYTSGYSRVLNSDKQNSMSYSLTVPPLHIGDITFSKEQRRSVAKLRSIFQLNGYLKFSVDGKEKEVHVSRVLRAPDRLFSTFTKMTFVRSVLSAKSTTRDRHSIVVHPPPQPEDPEMEDYYGY